MYNKKILLEAIKNLEKAKTPARKKDITFDPTGKGMLNPIYAGKPVVLPTDTLYNPTPYPIKATSDNGIQKFLNPFDETNVHFPGASSIKEEPLMKKGGSKKQSKSLSATNKLLKKNPLFKKKNYKGKTYDPSAMYFQDGGFIPYDYNPYVSAEAPMEDIPFVNPIITGTEPEDYQAFLDYSRTAPENRRPNENYFYGDPDNYDHYGMWEALGKPRNFQEALDMNPDWEPDPYDKMYHGFSVNPETGVFLKSGKPGDTKEGDTTWMEIAGHYLSPRANESTPVFDPELQRFKYIPNPSFQKGGQLSRAEYIFPGNYVDEYPMMQTGGQRPVLYVDPNDPAGRARYKVYQDSLSLYNRATERINYWRNNPTATNVELNRMEDRFNALYPVSRNSDIMGSSLIEATGYDFIGQGAARRGVPLYDKPTQPVKYKPNPEIVAKQQQLIDAGYKIGKADGIWGDKSKAAWEEFQAQQTATPEPEVVEATPEQGQQVLTPVIETRQSTTPVAQQQPTATQPPTGYNVWTHNGQPLDPAVYGWAPSTSGPRQISQFADTHSLERANKAYTQLNATPWATQGNKLLTDLSKPYFTKAAATSALAQTAEQLGVPVDQLEIVKAPAEYSGYVVIQKLSTVDKFQKGGVKMSREEFEKRKAAYKKLTGRDFEPPKTFKPSEKARQQYQEKYNQQPVVQQQPSETIQQSTGLPIEEVTRRGQAQQIRESEKENAKVAYLDRAATNYMNYHNETYGSEYGFKTYEQALQEVSNPEFGGLEKYYNMYNPGPKNEELSAYEEQGMASRTWDVITNPFTAFKYSVQTGDFRNMPQYINEARMAGYDVDPDNLVGNAINTFANPFDVTDKVVRNTAKGNFKQAGLEALRMAPIPLAKYVPTVLRGANKSLSYAPIKQLPWLTGHNAINAHFAYETFKPEGFLDKSYEGFKEEDYGKGFENALLGSLGIAPFIRPGMQTVKAVNELRTPGSFSFIPGAGKYSLAYKSPMESGLLVGNPNLGEAAPAFEKIVNPLSRFTKEAGLGEFRILKQNQAVSNVKPNALLGDMTRAGQAVEVTTPALMENVPRQLPGFGNANPISQTSGMSAYTDEVAVFSKNDNELAANIIDDIRNRKLELWKTPEGKRRLQKMIDNTPALKGQTPESLSEAMEQVTNVNRTYSDKLKALDDIDSKKRQIEIAYDEGYLSVADYKIEINELDQKERILISNLKDIEIALKQYSGAFDLNTRTFEQGVRIQPGAFPLKELPLVTSHELAHFLSSFKKVTPTYIDKQLEGLQLITDFSKQIKIPFAKTTPEKSSAYTVLKADKEDYLKEAVKYWNEGSEGTEKTSFLAEVREDMLQKGIIKSEYQPITNRMLKAHYENYKKAGDSKFPLRVYDIMQNKSENFNLLEKVINNLPIVIGGALAADSFMDENNSDLSEASVSALFAFLLKKPATFKINKQLKTAFEAFRKGGLEALKPGQLKAIKKEINLLDKKKDNLYYNRYGSLSLESEFYEAKANLTRKEDDIKSKLYKTPDRDLDYIQRVKSHALNEKALKQANYEVVDGTLTTSEETSNVFQKTLNTGVNHVFDFMSGAPVKVEVVLPKSVLKYSIDPKTGKLVTSFDVQRQPTLTPEYIQSRKNSIAKVENDIPGAKVFGSTRLVTEGGMPHISNDIDLLILESDYQKNVVGKYDFVQDYGPAKQHNIYPEYGEEGLLDFNIIHENPDGAVKPVFRTDPQTGDDVSLEIDLFRQFYPAEFFEASKKAIVSGKPFEINMSAKEFMAGIDPGIKSVIDSYEASPTSRFGNYKSSKEKHTLRPDALISYGDPKTVAKGQEAFIKSLVGSKGSLGHQFSKTELSDVDRNILTLMAMNYKGSDLSVIAENPERMQLVINDFYINSTGFSREITPEKFTSQKYNEKEIIKAFTEWFPGAGGGSVNGIGLNTVQLGNPLHKDKYQNPLIGHVQLNINTNTENPLDYVKSINRATSGKYVFTPQELSIVEKIFSKYIDIDISQIKTSRDVLNLNFPYDTYKIADKPAKEFAETLGIRAIRRDVSPSQYGGRYGTSIYASILGNVDETLDAMMYSFKNLHGVPKAKSERLDALSKHQDTKTKAIETIEDFKMVSSLIQGGFEKTMNRYKVLQNTIANLDKQREVLINKKTVKEQEELKRINQLIKENKEESEKISNQIAELYTRKNRIRQVRGYLLDIVAVGGALASIPLIADGASTFYQDYFLPSLQKDAKAKQKSKADIKLQQGGTPSEIWKQHTGTSWSEAKRQGLTDGSAAQNIALANRVLAGEFGESQVSYEDYQNSRAAYDQMVVDKVIRGATLDDLVTQRVGTRSGLINRFPDLFNQQSPQQPKTLPDKPSAKKENIQRNSPASVKETPVITRPVVKPQQQTPLNINELREKIKELKRKNQTQGPTALLRQYMKDPLKYAKELEALKNFNQVPKQSLHPSLYLDQSTFTPPSAMLSKGSPEVPSLSRKKDQQPIAGGIGSKISNTGTPGFINQDLLRFTEDERQRHEEEAKGRIPYKEPSFVDGIFKAVGQAHTVGLDINKGVDEIVSVVDDYTRNFNSYFDRFLIKEGYKKADNEVVQAKPTNKIKEVKPEVENFYEQIKVTGDKHSKALPGSQLLSYRSQWDANNGFTFYNTEPKNKQRDINKTYNNVEGVGHFILDASPLDGKTYMHANNFAFINAGIQSDNYIPIFEPIPNSDGQVIMKYKKPSEMTEEELKALSIFTEYAERAAKAKNKSEKDQIAKEYTEAINYNKVKIVTPLRQYNFDDVDFGSSVKAPNFKQARYLKTKDGKLTNLLFTDPGKNKYGRFDGVTVSFIFKDAYGNNIVRDFSGTINDIQKEGNDIKTKYGLKDNELVIGYHDVGSFSAKPAAVNGKLSINFFDGYNNSSGTGSALIIPKQK